MLGRKRTLDLDDGEVAVPGTGKSPGINPHSGACKQSSQGKAEIWGSKNSTFRNYRKVSNNIKQTGS